MKDFIDEKFKDEKKDIKPVDTKKIQDFYDKYNYPSVDKLFKLLKADDENTTITRKEIKEYLEKKVRCCSSNSISIICKNIIRKTKDLNIF